MSRRYVDLSHPIVSGMTAYPGLDPPLVESYLDAPFHFHEAGVDVASLPLERLVDVPIIVVDALDETAVTAAAIDGVGEGHDPLKPA